MSLWRKTWRRWRAAAYAISHVQSMVVLSLVYVLAIGSIAIVGRLTGRDLLGLRRSAETSYWRRLAPLTSTVERAEQQF
jgi:hypothetical protein